jgi:protein SCO1
MSGDVLNRHMRASAGSAFVFFGICAGLSLFAPSVPAAGANTAVPNAKSASVQDASSVDRDARGLRYFGDAVLTDQDGRTHRFYSDLLRDRVVLINVVFTHCPSACPMMTEHLKKARRQLGARFGKEVVFLSLSVDPERDTPAALKTFAKRHGVDEPGWRFLVADAATMQGVLGKLGQWTDDPENHTTLLIAGRASQAHWSKLRPDASPERIVADLERLAE